MMNRAQLYHENCVNAVPQLGRIRESRRDGLSPLCGCLRDRCSDHPGRLAAQQEWLGKKDHQPVAWRARRRKPRQEKKKLPEGNVVPGGQRTSHLFRERLDGVTTPHPCYVCCPVRFPAIARLTKPLPTSVPANGLSRSAETRRARFPCRLFHAAASRQCQRAAKERKGRTPRHFSFAITHSRRRGGKIWHSRKSVKCVFSDRYIEIRRVTNNQALEIRRVTKHWQSQCHPTSSFPPKVSLPRRRPWHSAVPGLPGLLRPKGSCRAGRPWRRSPPSRRCPWR
jgi:hypothetical protein